MVCIIVLPPSFFLPREKKRKGVTVRDRVRKNNDGVVLRTFLCISTVFQKRIHTFWRKRSIPTHSGWLYPLTFDAEKGLKED